jgi:hypothetical protein
MAAAAALSDADMREAYGVPAVDVDVDTQRPPESSSEERMPPTSTPTTTATTGKKRRRVGATAAAARTSVDVDVDSMSAVHCARPVPVSVFDADAQVLRAIQEAPRIEAISRMTVDFPHMRTDSDCQFSLAKRDVHVRNTVAAAAAAAGPAMIIAAAAVDPPAKRMRLHYEASQAEPPALAQLLRAREDLLKVEYYVRGSVAPTTDDHMERLLRSERVSLPLFTVAHEQSQLIQSGVFHIEGREWRFPPCCRGTRCVASDRLRGVRDLPEPIVLMRAMTPEQWAVFTTPGGSPPPGRGPCILCHRVTLAAYVHNARLLLSGGGNSSSSSSNEDLVVERERPREVYQLWRNQFDCVDGYAGEYALRPRENEVLLDPVVEDSFWPLRAERQGAIWTVQQDGLLWRGRQQPSVCPGERLADF